ncbi:hypothetical protein FRC03_000031 [Tulasnella sp. 419]|nr:hypothetical protein FRC03_000031 [Tulasnella sp. 419]
MANPSDNYPYMNLHRHFRQSPFLGPVQQPTSYTTPTRYQPHSSTENVIHSENLGVHSYMDHLYNPVLSGHSRFAVDSSLQDDFIGAPDTLQTIAATDFTEKTPDVFNEGDGGSDLEDYPPLFLTQSTVTSSSTKTEPLSIAPLARPQDMNEPWPTPSPVSFLSGDEVFDNLIQTMVPDQRNDHPVHSASPMFFQDPAHQYDHCINPNFILHPPPEQSLVNYQTSQSSQNILVYSATVDSDLDAEGSEEDITQTWPAPHVVATPCPSQNTSARPAARKHACDDSDEYCSGESDQDESDFDYEEQKPKTRNRAWSSANASSAQGYRPGPIRTRGMAARNDRLSISSAPASTSASATRSSNARLAVTSAPYPTTSSGARLGKNRGPPPRTPGRRAKESHVCGYVQHGTGLNPCDSRTGNKYDMERHRREIHGLHEAECVVNRTLGIEHAKWYFEDFSHMIVKRKCNTQTLNEDTALRGQAQHFLRTVEHDDSPIDFDAIPLLREIALRNAHTYRLWTCPYKCTVRNPIQTERAFQRHMRNHKK